MSNPIMKAVVGATILAGLLAACGQSNPSTGAAAAGPSPVGSWLLTPNGGPTAAAHGLNLLTLTSDGLVLWSGGIATFGGGHGAWIKTGSHQVRVTFQFVDHDASGAIVGTGKSTANLDFVRSFDRFTSTVNAQLDDLQGKTLNTFHFAAQGVRITA